MVGVRWSALALVVALAGCGPGSFYRATAEERVAFGFIPRVDSAARTISFDEAEWLTGEEAAAAAVAAGQLEPGESVPNDYFIRNLDRRTIVLPVASNARIRGATPVTVLKPRPLCESCPFYPVSVQEFFAAWKGDRPPKGSFWVTTHGGEVVAIEEQYRP